MTNTLTAIELIELLSGFPPNAPVRVAGATTYDNVITAEYHELGSATEITTTEIVLGLG